MGAFHIVGKDFELRLGVHPGFVRKQEILIGLPGVGLLCAMADKHFAVKNSPRLTVKNSFIKLMTGAVRLAVIDD